MKKKKQPKRMSLVTKAGVEVERRVFPRISLSYEQFRLEENGRVYSVVDLSEKGMAIRVVDSQDLLLLTLGKSVQGILNLKREKYPIAAKVKHVFKDWVGLHFEKLKPNARKAIQGFLSPTSLGKELKPIPSSLEGTTLWFHGPTGTDFLAWKGDQGDWKKFYLFIFGSYVFWEAPGSLSTGKAQFLHQECESRGVFRLEQTLLEPDSKPDKSILELARRLIHHSNLPKPLKGFCTSQLESQAKLK